MTVKKYLRRIDKSSDVNPWINELATTITTKNKIQAVGQSKAIVDNATGEIMQHEQAMMVNKKAVDDAQFIKIFASGLAAMFDLSKTAQDMFKAILNIYLSQVHQPLQVFVNEDTLGEVSYTRSKPTRIRAINELIKADFIAQVANRPSGFFWTNPNMFYKGNRLTIITQYAKKGTAEGDAMQAEITQAEQQEKQKQIV